MFKQKKKIISTILIMILSILSFSGCVEDNSEVIHVDINGGGDFKNIQEAIENVAVGGTIQVGEGSYHELLKVSKSINLIGEDNGKTIIIQSNVNSNFNSVIQVDADNCLIKGFNIICNKVDASSVDVIGINISSSNNTILNNIINGSSKGIYLNRNSKNNNISSNIISNSSNGIYTIYSERNKILRNNISFCSMYGIYILNSDNNTISNNLVLDNDYGIRIKGSTGNLVFNNYISRNQRGILCCCGATDNVIYNNVFKENPVWNAEDEVSNQWDNGFFGNYWGDYTIKHPNAKDTEKDGIWDIPYVVTDDNLDRYPLVYQPSINK